MIRLATHPPRARILALFFVSGATSLVYEVLWLRQLILVLGSTLVMVGLLMWQGRLLPDPARGNQKMLIALAVWTLAGLPYCVSMFVRTSEIKLRTDLLRVELALAELGERQGRRPE